MQKKRTNNLVKQGATRTLIALSVAAAFPMHAALAQTTPANTVAADGVAESTKLETVIVTGARRSENLREVPLSISSIKGEALDTYNAGGQPITFLAQRVPSLNVESDFGRTFPRFYIRGLGNTDFDLNASQPVGLIYDDVVQENPMLKGFPVFDVDHIEVLRGPQGTLFGRNSPAGVVKFDSAKPSNVYEGYANLGYGNYGAANLEGAINVPLSDRWAMRLSGQSQSRDDRVYNTNPNPNTGTKTFEGYHDNAARLQLQYKDGGFTGLFNVHGRDMKSSATLFRANIIQKGTNNIVPGFDYSSYPTDGINVQTLTAKGANLNLRWDLDGISLYSISAYDRTKVYSRADVDGGFGASFAPPMGPGFIPFPSETADGLPFLRQLTQEFRVQSNTKAPLQWIAGVYYFKEDIQVDSFDYNSLAGNVQDGYANQHQHAKSWATFGSLTYAVNDKLKLTGGLRYTDDKKDFDAQRFQSSIGGGPTDLKTAHPSSTNVSWDLGANYLIDSTTSVYSRIATGYRAPSIQGRILFGNDISVANSEKNLSVEAGIKKDLLDNTARISATVFSYRVKDLQLTAGSGSVNQNRLVNADKATGQGFELEAQANLSRNWKATVSTSYNKTEIKDPGLFVSPCGNGCTVTNPAGPVAGTVLINGNPLPRAPEWVGNFTLRYTVPLANGDFYVYTDWAYKDKYNMFLYEAKEYTAKSLLEGGLRVGYKWGNGKYELAAYGRNITNKQQIIAAIDFNNLTGILNEPRAYGVQFKANF
ncbi:MAG: TonB-dependent receptor [Pseudomonadota bacterium]